MNKTLTLVLAYAVAAFLTFAYAYDGFPEPKDNHHEDVRQLGSAFAAALWPIYLGGTVALIAVRAAKAPSTCK